MAKVKFLERCVTKEAHPQTFEAGKVYDLPDASADRWERRGKAERVGAAPRPEPETDPAAKPKARKGKQAEPEADRVEPAAAGPADADPPEPQGQ